MRAIPAGSAEAPSCGCPGARRLLTQPASSLPAPGAGPPVLRSSGRLLTQGSTASHGGVSSAAVTAVVPAEPSDRCRPPRKATSAVAGDAAAAAAAALE